MNSYGTVDFVTGATSGGGGGGSLQRRRNVHGILNAVSWGTLLPLGAMIARNIGMTLFVLGTLQVFALLLRPKKDHKIRMYWNVYHWAVGYVTIILSIVNIFEGFDILQPHKNWKRAYISIIIFLGSNAVMLEAYTWYLVMKRKKTGSDKYPDGSNGVNGYGNGARSQI
ncbi:hypothetical protein Vadar_012135 [Vaccinium darrowii]|uniref:Uncharacterized protein n=1 Tax=Vaccinium darrowii TaxID=229202 RepID=A0ACB7Z355_9ERIC|nr:hypothetical protein Vadar_012135 [Vaccinium darrowii]